MPTLWIDLETFNTQDISVGTYRYAETAEILIAAYAIDGGPSKVWDCTKIPGMPRDLVHALQDPTVGIVAHNAMFDRSVIREQNWPADQEGGFHGPDRWRCTMVHAMLHGFPGSLDQLCTILDLPQNQSKLGTGKSLIRRFCKPAASNHRADRYDRHSHPEEWAQFIEYARMDIDSMREVARRLPNWNCDWPMWRLDQRINDRGFRVDTDLTNAGMSAAQSEKDDMAREFSELTRYRVARPTQREQLRQFLNSEYDLDLENTQRSTLSPLVGTLDGDGNRLLELALAANKTSTAKYKALHHATSTDGRFRGGLQFSGAARTRRWGGRTFQPQNLPSRGLPPASEVNQFIAAIKLCCHGVLFSNPVYLMSAALRGVVLAAEGKRLEVADLSNIEGRVNAWLAGEQWKLDAFAAFDEGYGDDLYNITAGSILGKSPNEIAKSERNSFGKIPELALGYEGGYGAFQTFARAYGVQMRNFEHEIMASEAGTWVEKAEENWQSWGKKLAPDADPREWLLSECVKLSWRDKNSAIEQLWYDCKNAAFSAVESPGEIFPAGPHLKFKMVKHGFWYLLCRMPSGKTLTYFDPRIQREYEVRNPSDAAATETVWATEEPPRTVKGTGNRRLSYMGIDALTKQWRRLHTYGGKFVENACQSLSLDILQANMPLIEQAGYEIILTVHDEVVTEAPDTDGYSNSELSELLATNPPWAVGLPLSAAGFTDTRYRKD